MGKIKEIIKKAASVACTFVLGVTGLFAATPAPVTVSAEGAPSSVMDDLSLDENFDASMYPSVERDYSLKVIQIAESAAGELLIYVYQPCDETRELVATSINVSMEIEGDNPASYQNYKLRLQSTEGVFDKYVVENIKLKEDVLRFYSITAIYRAFDKEIDNAPIDDNVIEEIAYPVGQLWTATTYEGTSIYAVRYLDLITVESKHVGFVRYYNGGIYFAENTDSHYVAFSTDRQIDDLLEVEMQYKVQAKVGISTTNLLTGNVSYTERDEGEQQTIALTLNKNQVFEGGGGIFAEKYQYNRIQSIDEFKSNEDLTAETVNALDGQKWVLRFAETDFTQHIVSTSQYSQQVSVGYSQVSSVVLFRLEYEYDGQIYNLGVVDNISRGDTVQDINPPIDIEVPTISLEDIVQGIFDWESGIFGGLFDGGNEKGWLRRVVVIVLCVVVLFFAVWFLRKLLRWLFVDKKNKGDK